MKTFVIIVLAFLMCNCYEEIVITTGFADQTEAKANSIRIENPTDFYQKLSNAAISIIDPEVVYTRDYVGIKYPNGDVLAKTGDIVTWLLAGDAIPHIGIVTLIKSSNGNPMIVHNV